MSLIQVNASYSGTRENPVDQIQATFGVEDGGSLDGAIELHGAEVVFGQFQKGLKTTARNALRGQLQSAKSGEAALEKMANWKPGVSMERTVDINAALRSQFAGMSKKEKVAEIKRIQAITEAA